MKIKYRNLQKMFGVLFVMISLSGFVQSQPLSKGSIAPTFSSEATRAGKEFHFSMKDAVAKGPVVVYFFPSAYTGGCDLEAHTFATLIDKFKEAGTTVIGISADDIQRLNSFSADPDFCAGTFPIASDP
ncbi:MAG TPA: redoxin domain-containing protein, partial [Chitinophagaceae bacterium]